MAVPLCAAVGHASAASGLRRHQAATVVPPSLSSVTAVAVPRGTTPRGALVVSATASRTTGGRGLVVRAAALPGGHPVVGAGRSPGECPFAFMFRKVTQGLGAGDKYGSGRFQAPEDWEGFLHLGGEGLADKHSFVEQLRRTSRALHQVTEDGKVDLTFGNGLPYKQWAPTVEQVLALWVDLLHVEAAFEALAPAVLESYPDCEYTLSGTTLASEVVRQDVDMLMGLVGAEGAATQHRPSSECVEYVAYLEDLARDGNSLGLLTHAYLVYSFIYSGGIQVVLHHCDSSKLEAGLKGEGLRLLSSHSARCNKQVVRDCRSILKSVYLAANGESQTAWDVALDTIPAGFSFMLPITRALAPPPRHIMMTQSQQY